MKFTYSIIGAKVSWPIFLFAMGVSIISLPKIVSAQTITVSAYITPNWPAVVGIGSTLSASASVSPSGEGSAPTWTFTVSVQYTMGGQTGTYGAATLGTDYTITSFSDGSSANQTATITFKDAGAFYKVTVTAQPSSGGSGSTTTYAYAVAILANVSGPGTIPTTFLAVHYTATASGGTPPYQDNYWGAQLQNGQAAAVDWGVEHWNGAYVSGDLNGSQNETNVIITDYLTDSNGTGGQGGLGGITITHG